MKWHVYILYSKNDEKLYIGCTSNVADRMKRHDLGQVAATKHRRPLTLIHNEEFKNKTTAFQRERFLKSLWGGRIKKNILKEFLRSPKA